MRNPSRMKSTISCNTILTVLIIAFVYVGYSQPLPVTGSGQDQKAGDAATQRLQPCKAKLGDDIEPVSYSTARNTFINQSRFVRTAASVHQPSDIIGSIMFFGQTGRWLLVTDIEMRYDPTREFLAFSRLEGYLHNGQPLKIDKTDRLPDTFLLVKDWRDVGPVIIRDIDGKIRKLQSLEFEIADDGRFVKKEVGINNSGLCRAGGGVDCWDFCIGDCTVRGSDCRCEFDFVPKGFCTTAPGLNCGGGCPIAENTCTAVTPNPGAIFCSCIPNTGPGPILDSSKKD